LFWRVLWRCCGVCCGFRLRVIALRDPLLSEDENEGANFKLDIQAFFKSSMSPPARAFPIKVGSIVVTPPACTVFNLLPASGRVVVVDGRCSLMAAWAALAVNDTPAAAVWSDSLSDFCGAFCVNDIVAMICRHCLPSSSAAAAPTSDVSCPPDSLTSFRALSHASLADYMAIKGERLDMSPNDTIFNICSLMQARRCRFLPIIERDQEGGGCHAVQVLCARWDAWCVRGDDDSGR
jgi:hypothetical protein